VRARTLACALFALPLLVGCDLTASLTIAADRSVQVDATIWAVIEPSTMVDDEGKTVPVPIPRGCELADFAMPGVDGTDLTDPSNPRRVGCHWAGTTTYDDVKAAYVGRMLFTESESRYLVLVPPGGFSQAFGPSPDFGGFDLQITYPGRVVAHDASSTVDGNTVRWSNATKLASSGMSVSAAKPGDHPGPPNWLPLLAGGAVLLGAAGASVVALGRGRRRLAPSASDQIDSQPDADAPVPAEVEPEPVSEPPEPPEDHSVWAPDADR